MIYFVRHGLSEANVRRVFVGRQDDSPLVDKGRNQAKETADKILKEGIKIDKIVSSPSKRTLETAQIIADVLGFDEENIVIDKRIIEYDMGNLSGKPWQVISSSILINTENAEDVISFKDRVIECIKELSKIEGNILLVSHGGVGRILETLKNNNDPKIFYDTPVWENGSITKIDWIK